MNVIGQEFYLSFFPFLVSCSQEQQLLGWELEHRDVWNWIAGINTIIPIFGI